MYTLAMNTQNAPVRSYRVNLSLPVDMAKTLSRIAKRFRMSQSALLTLVMEEPLEALDRLSALMPLPDDQGVTRIHPGQVRRLRGASGEELRKAIKDALEAAEAVDPAPGLDL